jgi:hypothetical protein
MPGRLNCRCTCSKQCNFVEKKNSPLVSSDALKGIGMAAFLLAIAGGIGYGFYYGCTRDGFLARTLQTGTTAVITAVIVGITVISCCVPTIRF